MAGVARWGKRLLLCAVAASALGVGACSSNAFDSESCQATATCDQPGADGDAAVEGDGHGGSAGATGDSGAAETDRPDADASVSDASGSDASLDALVTDEDVASVDAGAEAPDGGAQDDAGDALADTSSDASDDGATDAEGGPALAPNGAACVLSTSCKSQSCADGFCCDKPCGICARCDVAGFEGTCTPMPNNTDPDHECTGPGGASDPCAGHCNGSAACAFPTSTTTCGVSTCTAATETDYLCDGAGTCAPGSKTCGAYGCGGAGLCHTSCATDAECSLAGWCSAGTCVAKLPIGSACGAAGQCGTGYCVDGRCCGDGCTGTCLRCDVAGVEGTCMPLAQGTDPDHECLGTGAAGGPCIGACSGAGACTFPTGATSCGPPTCTGGVETDSTCSGGGSCTSSPKACGLYACGATACRFSCTTDADCASSAWCNAGACAPRKATGSTCGGANQCSSGFCVDGRCCGGACSGKCQRCDLAGTEGTCSPIAAGTDPYLECVGTGGSSSPCTGTCDGSGACAFPTTPVAGCSSSICGSGLIVGHSCNGLGACDTVYTDCLGYGCASSSACKTSCTTGTDCVTSYYCGGSECLAEKSNGAACSSSVECSSGQCVGNVCCSSACGAPSSCATGTCLCGGTSCAYGHSCITWYLDQDNDGHAQTSSLDKPACDNTPPATPGGTGGYKTTSTDCYDHNPYAQPGQPNWFTADRGDGSWDYDCDGGVTPKFPNIGTSTCQACSFTAPTIPSPTCQTCGFVSLGSPVYTLAYSCQPSCGGPNVKAGFSTNIPCGATSTLHSCATSSCTAGSETTTTNTVQACH